MSVSVYYRSIDSMHPARAFQISEHAAKRAVDFDWLLCDAPTFRQDKDGYLIGSVQPYFDENGDSLAVGSARESIGELSVVVDLLAELSAEHDVDWELSHDYEPNGIGRIIEGEPGVDLKEEIESVVRIGSLFGDIGLDEETLEDEWEETTNQFGVWRATIHEASANYARDEPTVLKFPGVK